MSKIGREVFPANQSLHKERAIDLYFLGGAAILGSVVLVLMGTPAIYAVLGAVLGIGALIWGRNKQRTPIDTGAQIILDAGVATLDLQYPFRPRRQTHVAWNELSEIVHTGKWDVGGTLTFLLKPAGSPRVRKVKIPESYLATKRPLDVVDRVGAMIGPLGYRLVPRRVLPESWFIARRRWQVVPNGAPGTL